MLGFTYYSVAILSRVNIVIHVCSVFERSFILILLLLFCIKIAENKELTLKFSLVSLLKYHWFIIVC